MSPQVLTLLSALAVVLTILGLYSFLADILFRDQSRIGQRVDEEFRQKQRQQAKKSSLFKNLSSLSVEAYEELDIHPSRHLEILVEQSGLELTVTRLLGFMAGLGISLGGLLGLFRQSVVLGLSGLLLGSFLPYYYVRRKRSARQNKLLSQLPEAFDLMSRTIRAGQSLPRAMLAVADEFDKPISAEFSYCYEQMNLGLSPELALRDLARRTGVLEIKIFVLAVIVQQQTGGNLAELFDKLSSIVRERFRVQSRVRVLTAEGRLSAIILMVLPWAMFGLLLLINPKYAGTLFEDNFRWLLGLMFTAEGLGGWWIYRIVNFDF